MSRSEALQRAGAVLQPLLIYFSASHLLTTQFLRNSQPAPDIFITPPDVMASLVVILQVLPALALLLADRLVAWRGPPGSVRLLRSAVMAFALVVFLRQLQLFWGPAQELVDAIQRIAVPLYTVVFLAAVGLIVVAAGRFYGPLASFFAYFAPAALVISLLMVFEEPADTSDYVGYSGAEVMPASTAAPPLFVVVFDEFSREVLLGPDGAIDGERYPGFARLAAAGAELTNATTNQFYTWLIVPEMIDALRPYAPAYELRLYEQTRRLEHFYAPGCGSQYTCRGSRYLGERDRPDVILNTGMRALYKALPERLESLGRPPLHAILRSRDLLPPPADPDGVHTLSRDLTALYLTDIRAEAAGGRIFFLHAMLPHSPFVFDAAGDFESDEYRRLDAPKADGLDETDLAERRRQYREQAAFTDRFVGALLDRLESEGLIDSATLIVTADHGLRTAFPFTGEALPIARLTTDVPMFILSPGIAPGPSAVDYQHVDFGATVYDLIGPPAGELLAQPTAALTGAGVSAFAETRPEREKVFLLFQYFDLRAWRYALDEHTSEWRLTGEVDWPVGDRTLF